MKTLSLILMLFISAVSFSQDSDTALIVKVVDNNDHKTVTVHLDPVELKFPYEDDNTYVIINNSRTDIIQVVVDRNTKISECVGLNITQYYQLKTKEKMLLNQLVVFSQYRNKLTSLNINCFN